MNKFSKLLGKEFEIIIDRQIGSEHPKFKNWLYPINYGYIENIKAGDGDDVDVFVIDLDKPVKSCRAKIIAIIHRTDDKEDKLVGITKDREYSDEEIEKKIEFQEKFFKHELIR
jgi:inorganic pyrophosphatase